MDGREQTASEWDKEESVVCKFSKYQQGGVSLVDANRKTPSAEPFYATGLA